MTAPAAAGGVARADVRWFLRAAYIVIIGFATLAQVDLIARDFSRSLDSGLRPLRPSDVVDAIRNVVLFAGWGAVWVATAPAGTALRMVRDAVLTGIALSVTVEGLQFFSAARHPSVIDVFTNTTGAIAGAGALALGIVFVRAGRGARSFVGIPMLLFAGPYGLVVMLEAFGSLFRQERMPRVGGGAAGRFQAALDLMQPVSASSIPWFDLVLFSPAGFLGVAALVELRTSYRAAALIVALSGGLAVVLAELARGFAGHAIAYGPMIAHVPAIALGAWAATLLVPRISVRLRGARRALALLASYAALVALWTFRPFYPEFEVGRILRKLTLQHFVPLRAYLDRVELLTAVDVLLSFLLFVPIGCLLAVWPLRAHGPLRGMLPGLYAAAGLEIAQLFVAGRWFDVTDIIVHGAAVALGWVVVRRAGFKPYGEALPDVGPRGAPAQRAGGGATRR